MSEASQRALEARMTHSVQVARRSLADAGSGRYGATYADVGGAIACRIFPLSMRERAVFSREDARVTHKCLLPARTDVRRTDRLTRAGDSGGTFEVISVQEGGELGHHLRALLFRDERGI